MTHLLLTHDFPPMGGGVARWMGELAKRYDPGHLIVSTGAVAGGADVDEAYPNRVDRLDVPTRQLRTLPGVMLWSRRVAMLARQSRAEFVWCGNIKPSAYPAEWTHERLGVPFGIFAHGADLLALQHQVHQSRLRRQTAKQLLGAAALFVTNSEWTRQLCLGVLRELELDTTGDGRVHTVQLGTDPYYFRPGVDTAAARERYGLAEGRWLVSVSRLVAHKGIDTVIEALAHLDGKEKDVRYAVVGSGEGLTDLRTLVKRKKLGDRVVFLTDVPDADLPALYNLASVYVGASRRAGLSVEGFGIALAEAAACGVPVVAGRSGGIPEAVRHGETGLLVDPESPDAVAEAIRTLLRDPAEAQRLGAAGRAAIERHFNWDRVMRDLHALATAHAKGGIGKG